MEKLTFNDKRAESYGEAILYCLANHGNGKIHVVDEIEPALQAGGYDFNRQKVTSVISNFKKIGLLKKIKLYQFLIDRDAAFALADNYSKGKCGLWFNEKKTSGLISGTLDQYKRANSNAFYARAIFAAYNKVLSIAEIINIATAKFGVDNISKKSIQMFIWNNKEVFNIFKSGEAHKLYGPNPLFFKRFKSEIGYYKEVFPEKADVIENRYAMAIENNKTVENKSVDFKLSRVLVVRAILAAYQKPLTYKNISRLAARFGYEVNVPYMYSFKNKFNDFLETVDKGMRAIFIRANDKFFKEFVHEIDIYVDLLENRKDQIYARFNQQEPGLAKAHEDAHRKTFDEGPAPDDEKATALVAPEEEEDAEQVSAADVGASIIAYVDKLKCALKKRQDATDTARDEKEHVRSLHEKILELQNERTALTTKSEKQAAIITSKDQALKRLESELSLKAMQISKLEIKLEKAAAGKTKFTLGEVASITTLVKGKGGRLEKQG